MEKTVKHNIYILFITNRVLSLTSICFFYMIIDEWYEEQTKMLSWGPIQYSVADLFAGVILGILLGWFLCDSISITESKFMNIVLIIALVILATYKMMYFALGSVGIITLDGISKIIFDLSKCFQMTLGTFIFLMIYKKAKAF